jgi:hypothetical protein
VLSDGVSEVGGGPTGRSGNTGRLALLDVACPSCGDETVWRVVFDRHELPTSFRIVNRESQYTCDHWEAVHELAFQRSFTLRRRLPIDAALPASELPPPRP